MAKPPTIEPTAIPALSPPLRLLFDVPPEAEEVALLVAVLEEPKSEAVTLKQGTWALKSAVSTNVYQLSAQLTSQDFQAHNVCASVKGLVLVRVVIGPVFQLDCGIRSRRQVAWKRVKLVALVSRLYLGDVAHDLFLEVALTGRICNFVSYL